MAHTVVHAARLAAGLAAHGAHAAHRLHAAHRHHAASAAASASAATLSRVFLQRLLVAPCWTTHVGICSAAAVACRSKEVDVVVKEVDVVLVERSAC